MADRVRRVCGNTIQANCWSRTTDQEEVGQQCFVFVIVHDNCRRQGWRRQQRRISYDSSSLISIGILYRSSIRTTLILFRYAPFQGGHKSWASRLSSRQIQTEQKKLRRESSSQQSGAAPHPQRIYYRVQIRGQELFSFILSRNRMHRKNLFVEK